MRQISGIFLVIMAVIAWDQPDRLQAQSIEGTYSPEADRLFAQGLQAYRVEEYEEARIAFARLLEMATHQHSSAGQLMLGKSHFRLGNYEDARWPLRVVYRKRTSIVVISQMPGC